MGSYNPETDCLFCEAKSSYNRTIGHKRICIDCLTQLKRSFRTLVSY